jgi:hypothetical protein
MGDIDDEESREKFIRLMDGEDYWIIVWEDKGVSLIFEISFDGEPGTNAKDSDFSFMIKKIDTKIGIASIVEEGNPDYLAGMLLTRIFHFVLRHGFQTKERVVPVDIVFLCNCKLWEL